MIESFIVFTAVFCQFKNINITHEQKVACMEYMVNCSIVKAGETNKQLMVDCSNKWRPK